MNSKIPNDDTGYLTAQGEITYNMTNDYMFRVILQENDIVLRSLICSLLRLKPDSISSVKVTNPIILGENINDKTFVLDVNVIMNDYTVINLEMQMQDNGNWTDRALHYLCRNFNKLQKGDDYLEAKPVVHIGFLNYNLFPEHPEFYARYQMQNIKSHYLFSSKMMIGVVNLNQIEIATDEDQFYGLDEWVALFKSKTWEELRMIANEKPELLEASKSLYQYNNEETIRWQCWAREDYRRQMNTIERDRKEYLAENARLKAEKAELTAQLAAQEEQLSAQEKQLSAQEKQLSAQEKQLSAQEKQLNDLLSRIAKLEAQNQE